MYIRIAIAMISALALILGLSSLAGTPGKAVFVGSFRWTSDNERFGGFSGLELGDDGARFWTISDRGVLALGQFQRDPASDAIVGASQFVPLPIRAPDGEATHGVWTDAEGLAVSPDGEIYVSFEGEHRIWRYAKAGGNAAKMPEHPDFDEFQNNSGLEVLAMDPQGDLFAVPERSGVLTRPFPVYRFQDGVWQQPFGLPRRSPYLAVGGDFGPDGKFYLLERHFNGVFGFSSRVRRFTFSQDGISDEETLLETTTGRFDNLEGIAVWRDSTGDIRLTMISDDNFRSFQRTEFVEFRLLE
jgi:hypothetical protein